MAEREGTLRNYLVRQARAAGIYHRKVVAVGRTGFPDELLARDGKVWLVELKHPNGRGVLSAKQDREIKRLTTAGLDARVIWKKEEVDELIEEIAGARIKPRPTRSDRPAVRA